MPKFEVGDVVHIDPKHLRFPEDLGVAILKNHQTVVVIRRISPEVVDIHDIRTGERLLCRNRTGWSDSWFVKDHFLTAARKAIHATK